MKISKDKIIAFCLIIVGCLIVSLGILKIISKPCDLIPREVLFGDILNQKTQPTISPDGKYIAYLAPDNSVMKIWLKTTDQNDAKIINKNFNQNISTYMWSFDSSRIVYFSEGRLYGVSIKDGSFKEYTPFDNINAYVPYYTRKHPNRVVVGLNKRNQEQYDFYELNLENDDLKLISEETDKKIKWIPGVDLVIRGKIELLPQGGSALFVRVSVNDPWRLLLRVDNDLSGLTFFSDDGNYIYYFADLPNNNTRKFVKINVETGQIIELASDQEYDIFGDIVVDNNTFEPYAAVYERDRKKWVFFNQEIEKLFATFATIDQGDIAIESRTLDDTKWLISFTKDKGPISYWLFDRATNQKTFLFDNNLQFKKYRFSSMEPIEFLARDGLHIHGYLTYPYTGKKTNLPLVLLVQDNSWVRNMWGFNSEVQWLANRGYAVLQINARGSKGYGKAFFESGKKQWGQKMQNDLTDGVQWAIKKDIADPKHIAIFGSFYGGYAALVGATTSNLFCCAVDIFGPPDLTTFITSFSSSPYWSSIYYNRVGDPEKDKELLRSASPLFNIDAIKIPILIVQGANDPRVKQAEAEQIVEAMKKKGLAYEYLLFPDEGHGFVKPENRLKFYKTAEAFLAKHLGRRCEP